MKAESALLPWLLVSSALFTTACGPGGLQRQDQFAWAMKTGLGSTSPPIVRVRLVDSHGYSAVRCVRSDRLIEAIALENGLRPDKAGYDQAIAMALSSRDHSFRFVHPAARGVMSGSGTANSGFTKSCELIAQGKSVVWIKTRGTIAEGPHFPLADRAR